MKHYAIASIRTGAIFWDGRGETACAERLVGQVVHGRGETKEEAMADAVAEANRVRKEGNAK